MESIQQQMVEAKKHENSNTLKEVKRLCKELGFDHDELMAAVERKLPVETDPETEESARQLNLDQVMEALQRL